MASENPIAPAHKNNRRFSPEQEQQILAEYNAGASSPQLARRWNCGHAIIQRIVRRLGGRLRPMAEAKRGIPNMMGRRFSPAEENEICEEYASGMSTSCLSRKWHTCPSTIRQVARRGGQRIRCGSEVQRGTVKRMPRRCTLDESAFDCIRDDPLAAYFAGLLFADGNVSLCGGQPGSGCGQKKISINLRAEDVGIIYELRRFLSSSHAVYFQATKGGFSAETSRAARFSFASDRIAAKLAECGILPQKSLTATVTDWLTFNRDWWRGVIDGDGWAYFDGKGIPRIGLCGTRQTCERFLDFVRAVTPTRVSVHPNLSIFAIYLAHRHAVKVASALYEHCGPALGRKREVAEEMIRLGRERGWLPHPNRG